MNEKQILEPAEFVELEKVKYPYIFETYMRYVFEKTTDKSLRKNAYKNAVNYFKKRSIIIKKIEKLKKEIEEL